MYIINYIGVSGIRMGTVTAAIVIDFLVHLLVNFFVLLMHNVQEVHMVAMVENEELEIIGEEEEVGEEEEEGEDEEEEGEEEEEEDMWEGTAAAGG